MTKFSDKKIKDFIEKLPVASFTNEHGEKFNLHSSGIVVYMSGDEVDMMVPAENKIAGKYITLFNPDFSIWSEEELHKLGKALQELHNA